MKKILVSHDTELIADNESSRNAWKVDKILIWGSDLNNKLIKQLPDEKDEIVYYVPTIFDAKNAVSYEGVMIGLHILMRYMLPNTSPHVSVVLMGIESVEAFLRHFPYPNILKIPGIYYCLFNKKLVSNFNVTKTLPEKSSDYIPYLENLGLRLPSSFKSTHSMVNEWSLYKWNLFMGYEEEADETDGILYFDYLKTLNRLQGDRIHNSDTISHLDEGVWKKSRILLIDDHKKWHVFFRRFFSSNVEFKAIGEDFTKLSFPKIQDKINKEIEEFAPEVILLDFRLNEDKDSEADSADKITGSQILKNLKGSFSSPGKSFGRQILIFTATTRIENILLLKRDNADGFIFKENPLEYTGKQNTQDIISDMVEKINSAIKRAEYLIPLNEKMDQIVQLSELNLRYDSDNENEGNNVQTYIKFAVESVRQITQNNDLDENVLKLIFLNLFNIFEEIKRDKSFVEFPNDKSLIIKANKDLVICNKDWTNIPKSCGWNKIEYSIESDRHHCKDKDLNFAICAIILARLGYGQVKDTQWNKIREIRNYFAHGDAKRLEIKKSDKTFISYSLHMLDLIKEILDKDCIKDVRLPKQ